MLYEIFKLLSPACTHALLPRPEQEEGSSLIMSSTVDSFISGKASQEWWQRLRGYTLQEPSYISACVRTCSSAHYRRHWCKCHTRLHVNKPNMKSGKNLGENLRAAPNKRGMKMWKVEALRMRVGMGAKRLFWCKLVARLLAHKTLHHIQFDVSNAEPLVSPEQSNPGRTCKCEKC